ncbi:MAG TPA: AI-2E family transporter [Kofleriaceae bacterium]|nr:AI-2E family transporter [Kofleriaceae bacterium]
MADDQRDPSAASEGRRPGHEERAPGHEPPAATDGSDVRPAPGGFGRPGRPFRRGPFYIGLVGGLGLLTAYYGAQAVAGALNVLVLIFVAGFLAVGLNPAVVRLQRWGLPRGWAVASVVIGTLLMLCGGIVALVPPLVRQIDAFLEGLPGYLDALSRNEFIRDLDERYAIIESAKSVVTPGNLAKAVGGLLDGIGLVFGTLFNVLTVLLLTVYFLAAFERIKSGAYRFVPASRRDRARAIGDEILAKVGAYMAGALLIALLAGASSFVFLLVAGVAYPAALAVVVAVFDLIPQVGATLGSLVVILVAFVTSAPLGIAALVFFVLYQQLENWVIYPRVMSRAVRVTDLAAIISALLGAALLGVIGALIAIPASAAVQLVVREVVFPRQEAH